MIQILSDFVYFYKQCFALLAQTVRWRAWPWTPCGYHC